MAFDLLSLRRRMQWPPEAIAEYQQTRLRAIVRHAARFVPYYSRRFQDAGFDPFADVVDLRRLPISAKAELKAVRFEDRLAPGVNLADCLITETPGSTGEPMRIVHTRAEAKHLSALRLRAQMHVGLRPWHLRAALGSPIRVHWQHRLGLFRAKAVPLTESPRSILSALEALQPDILRSPPTALELLADESAERAGCD